MRNERKEITQTRAALNRWAAALLCAALCLALLPCAALAAARMPVSRGVVTDDADVLSPETASDLAAYAERVQEETEIRLRFAVVHFLDGMSAQGYADALFTKWALEEMDVLLVGAAGEDCFATAMGGKARALLGQTNAENLMYTSSSFSTLFRAQRYDEAFAAYCSAFNALAQKQTGERISLNGLFGTHASAKQNAAIYESQLWDEVMAAIEGSTEDYQQYHESRRHTRGGMSAGGWLVLFVLVMLVFGQSDPSRSSRRGHRGNYRSYGCGCSPLGWIVSLMGLNVLIDALRGPRRR